MDPWKEYAAREECRDVIRQWAQLEAKRLPTADDLVKPYAHRADSSIVMPLAISATVRVIAWAVETWWHVTRR
jgi:hypothetical protein